METPLFFRNKSCNLFGVLHSPDDHQKPLFGKKLGFVFCHPFAEEKLIAHRVMVNLARRLTGEGIYCLRFDYMGHGDSDADFEDSTIETRLSDIHCAVEYLKNRYQVERIGLLGVRLGATLAALVCGSIPVINALVLISPIVKGKPYIEQCLRSNLTTQMAIFRKIVKDREQLVRDLMAGEKVNIDGYLLTRTLYQQIEAINLLDGSSMLPQNVMLIQVSKNEKQEIEGDMMKLYQTYKILNGRTELLNLKEDHFWKDTKIYIPRVRNIEEALVKWIHKVCLL